MSLLAALRLGNQSNASLTELLRNITCERVGGVQVRTRIQATELIVAIAKFSLRYNVMQ